MEIKTNLLQGTAALKAQQPVNKAADKEDFQDMTGFGKPTPIENLIHMSNYGYDVKTKYINPKNPKEYLTMNEIALLLAQNDKESLSKIKGLNIKKIPSGKESVTYMFDDIMIEVEKDQPLTISFTDNKNNLKIQRRTIGALKASVQYLHGNIPKEVLAVQ